MSTIPLYAGDVPALNQTQPVFDTNTQAFIDYIATLAPEINAFAALLNALSTTDTSTTSNNVATLGAKTFTVSSGKSFFIGMSLTIANTAAPTNRMFAVVTSYSGATLQVTSQAFEGSGTFTAWSISASFNGVINTGQLADLGTTNAKLAQQYINDLTTVTALGADYIAIADTSDSGNKKKALISDIQTQFASNTEYATGTDTVKALNSATARARNIVAGTIVSATSGTSIDFTGIPSWVKRITVLYAGLSTNGTSSIIVQLGTSGGVETTGYLGSASFVSTGVGSANYTTGFAVDNGAGAVNVRHGELRVSKLDGNSYIAAGLFGRSDAAATHPAASSKTLSGTLDRIRITTVNGTDTFDAGSINIMYE